MKVKYSQANWWNISIDFSLENNAFNTWHNSSQIHLSWNRSHANMRTCTHAHVCACLLIRTHKHIHLHKHTQILTYLYEYMRVTVHALVHQHSKHVDSIVELGSISIADHGNEYLLWLLGQIRKVTHLCYPTVPRLEKLGGNLFLPRQYSYILC